MNKSLIWGKISLPKDSSVETKLQNIRLLLSSDNKMLSFKLLSVNDTTDNVMINRVIGQVQDMFLLPALPDRPLILKPKTNLSILPSTTFKFYVYLPVTFQLYSGTVKSENKVFEHALKSLSSTWFGEPNEGELCYVLYSSFDTEISSEKKGNDYVICPIEITNNSKEILEVKRLAVRGIHLNIYTNGELLISNKVKIKYDGLETISNVQFSKSSTTSIPDLKQIAVARIPENNTVFKRSFQLIRHITQY